MTEYIERTKALVIVDLYHGPRQAYHQIRNLQAADVAPVVHGHCEEVEPAYVKLDGQCCRCGIPMGLKDNFCPNCGARMDGE